MAHRRKGSRARNVSNAAYQLGLVNGERQANRVNTKHQDQENFRRGYAAAEIKLRAKFRAQREKAQQDFERQLEEIWDQAFEEGRIQGHREAAEASPAPKTHEQKKPRIPEPYAPQVPHQTVPMRIEKLDLPGELLERLKEARVNWVDQLLGMTDLVLLERGFSTDDRSLIDQAIRSRPELGRTRLTS